MNLFECVHKNGGRPKGIDTEEDIVDEFPQVLIPITDLNFRVKMPGSEEKYELTSLPHPANPRPRFLSFGSGDLRGVMWEVGRGEGLSNYWGIEYTVFEHELVIRFDLTTKPARALMANFTQARPLSPKSRKNFGMDEHTKANIPNMFRQPDYAPFPPLETCSVTPPRCIRDPKQPGMVHVIWDRRLLNSRQQEKDITTLLTSLQDLLPNKPQARRVRRSAWANYLRVLDARAVNPETQKPYATYEEIGFKVYGCRVGDYGTAKAQAKTAHNDARRLMDAFPP